MNSEGLATGRVTFTRGALLGNWTWSTIWYNFTVPTLPFDAVIHGIYPVGRIVRTGTEGNAANASLAAAKRMLTYAFSGGIETKFWADFDAAETNITVGGYYSVGYSGLVHAGSMGTTLAEISTYSMQLALFTGFGTGLTDVLTVENLGFAIYYTTASGALGNQSASLTEPFPIPAGQSVMWSVPLSVTAGDESGSPAHASNGSAVGTADVAELPEQPQVFITT